VEKYGVDPVWGFKGLSFWFTHPDLGERDARNALTRLNTCLRRYDRLRVPISDTEKIPARMSGTVMRERAKTKLQTLAIIVIIIAFALSLSFIIPIPYLEGIEEERHIEAVLMEDTVVIGGNSSYYDSVW
jgi:hypothetical protein